MLTSKKLLYCSYTSHTLLGSMLGIVTVIKIWVLTYENLLSVQNRETLDNSQYINAVFYKIKSD